MITVSPSPEEAREKGLNCRVKVKCGANIISGWKGAGITHCQVTDGRVKDANGTEGAAMGDDPMIALDVARKSCSVSDDGDKTFSVQIALTE